MPMNDAGPSSVTPPPAAQNKNEICNNATHSISQQSSYKRRCTSVQPSCYRRRRTSLGDYTDSKVKFNDLRCRLLEEKHEMEMKILQSKYELVKVELEIQKIKKAIEAKEQK